MKVDTVGIYVCFATAPGRGFRPPSGPAPRRAGTDGQLSPPPLPAAAQITPDGQYRLRRLFRANVRNGKQNTAEVPAMHYHK